MWQHVIKANRFASPYENSNTTFVSAEDLKNQVDELYGHFNKLAESLNVTKIKSDERDVEIGNYEQKVKNF